ncbi:hypothetical protein SNEBB_004491 [Seison nebaliae]|nr:hypothetical protein SNEBB_004491 [Seison nebaliae]
MLNDQYLLQFPPIDEHIHKKKKKKKEKRHHKKKSHKEKKHRHKKKKSKKSSKKSLRESKMNNETSTYQQNFPNNPDPTQYQFQLNNNRTNSGHIKEKGFKTEMVKAFLNGFLEEKREKTISSHKPQEPFGNSDGRYVANIQHPPKYIPNNKEQYPQTFVPQYENAENHQYENFPIYQPNGNVSKEFPSNNLNNQYENLNWYDNNPYGNNPNDIYPQQRQQSRKEKAKEMFMKAKPGLEIALRTAGVAVGVADTNNIPANQPTLVSWNNSSNEHPPLPPPLMVAEPKLMHFQQPSNFQEKPQSPTFQYQPPNQYPINSLQHTLSSQDLVQSSVDRPPLNRFMSSEEVSTNETSKASIGRLAKKWRSNTGKNKNVPNPWNLPLQQSQYQPNMPLVPFNQSYGYPSISSPPPYQLNQYQTPYNYAQNNYAQNTYAQNNYAQNNYAQNYYAQNNYPLDNYSQNNYPIYPTNNQNYDPSSQQNYQYNPHLFSNVNQNAPAEKDESLKDKVNNFVSDHKVPLMALGKTVEIGLNVAQLFV